MDVVSRPGDLVARFGGEEFVVTMPNTESEGAMQVAEEICEALRSRRLPHNGSPLGIVHHLDWLRDIGSCVRKARPGPDRDCGLRALCRQAQRP